MRDSIGDVRRQADALGRDGPSMQFLSSFSVVAAPNRALAQAKLDQLPSIRALLHIVAG
ncbi:hypothetical protein ACYX8G_01865 [Microbacterium saperdae]